MSNITVGDRVRLKPHPSFCQPLRKYGEEGRLATVVLIFIPLGSKQAICRVMFDMKRAVKNQQPFFLMPHELEKAP